MNDTDKLWVRAIIKQYIESFDERLISTKFSIDNGRVKVTIKVEESPELKIDPYSMPEPVPADETIPQADGFSGPHSYLEGIDERL